MAQLLITGFDRDDFSSKTTLFYLLDYISPREFLKWGDQEKKIKIELQRKMYKILVTSDVLFISISCAARKL